jgi:hypothetical protein
MARSSSCCGAHFGSAEGWYKIMRKILDLSMLLEGDGGEIIGSCLDSRRHSWKLHGACPVILATIRSRPHEQRLLAAQSVQVKHGITQSCSRSQLRDLSTSHTEKRTP